MSHTCHWPGCAKPVIPAMWGCKPHWFSLPKPLRDRIWTSYVPGQEISKTPSMSYIETVRYVENWILTESSLYKKEQAAREEKKSNG